MPCQGIAASYCDAQTRHVHQALLPEHHALNVVQRIAILAISICISENNLQTQCALMRL